MKLSLPPAALTAALLTGAAAPVHAQAGTPPASPPRGGGLTGNQQRRSGTHFEGPRMKLRLAAAALSAVLLTGAAAPVHAQAGTRPASPPRGGGMMGNQQRMNEMLFEGITLTAEQQAQVRAVDEKFKPRQDA